MFPYFAVITTKYEKQGKYLSYYCRMLSDILLLDRTNVSLFGAWDNDNKVTSTYISKKSFFNMLRGLSAVLFWENERFRLRLCAR